MGVGCLENFQALEEVKSQIDLRPIWVQEVLMVDSNQDPPVWDMQRLAIGKLVDDVPQGR